MNPDQQSRIREIPNLIEHEEDPVKVAALATELNDLLSLEQRERILAKGPGVSGGAVPTPRNLQGVHMARPTVLLADDHTLVVEALKSFLSREFDIVATVPNGTELLSVAPRLNPDVIVLDIEMPSASGVIAGPQIKKLLPRTKLIALTVTEDPDIAREAMRLWASGYVLKKSAGIELIHAIHEALRGRSYVTPSMTKQLQDAFIRDPRPQHKSTLTPRQREVLQLLTEGCTMRQVADQLHVSLRTIAFHKYRIMEEFGLKNTADIVKFAIREHVCVNKFRDKPHMAWE